MQSENEQETTMPESCPSVDAGLLPVASKEKRRRKHKKRSKSRTDRSGDTSQPRTAGEKSSRVSLSGLQKEKVDKVAQLHKDKTVSVLQRGPVTDELCMRCRNEKLKSRIYRRLREGQIMVTREALCDPCSTDYVKKGQELLALEK